MRLTDSPHDDSNHRQMALRSELRSVHDSIVTYCDMSHSLWWILRKQVFFFDKNKIVRGSSEILWGARYMSNELIFSFLGDREHYSPLRN